MNWTPARLPLYLRVRLVDDRHVASERGSPVHAQFDRGHGAVRVGAVRAVQHRVHVAQLDELARLQAKQNAQHRCWYVLVLHQQSKRPISVRGQGYTKNTQLETQSRHTENSNSCLSIGVFQLPRKKHWIQSWTDPLSSTHLKLRRLFEVIVEHGHLNESVADAPRELLITSHGTSLPKVTLPHRAATHKTRHMDMTASSPCPEISPKFSSFDIASPAGLDHRCV